MTRVVWLNGGLVDPAAAALAIDDPGVRHGVGLFETMRGKDGRVPWLERHLERLGSSAVALGFDPLPDVAHLREAVAAVARALAPGPARLRVTFTPHPTLLVEGAPLEPGPPELTAISIRGAWHPGRAVARHKSLSYLEWADADRRARAAGGDLALLLDDRGRLGEASIANVMCVLGERIVTAPVDGILPGITRDVVMELADVEERVPDEREWRGADEMFVTNALRGVVPVTAVDGVAVGRGPGPVTVELAARIGTLLQSG